MAKHHLDRRELERLEAGELSQAETTEVSRHLIHCAQCRKVLGSTSSEAAALLKDLLQDLAREGVLSDVSSAFARSLQTNVAEDLSAHDLSSARVSGENARDRNQEMTTSTKMRHADLATLREELLALDPAARRQTIRNDPSFHRLKLAELLLESSWNARSEDPWASEQLGFDALAVLEMRDDDFEDQPRLSDLKAQAWICIANARRIRTENLDAGKAFDRAESCLTQGTRDPRRRAEFLRLKCTYLLEMHRFDEAETLADQAIAIFRWARDVEGECTVLINKANIREIQGDLAGGIAILQQAEVLIDSSFDSYLTMCVRLSMVSYLAQSGRAKEAEALLPQARKIAAEAGKRLDLHRLRWLEARIAWGLDDNDRAERLFRQVREAFLDEGLGYDAALASLELATLLLEQNRTAETRELAGEMLRIFESLDIRREAFAALIMFQKAALQEEATVQMARDLVQYLQNVSVNPALQYEQPS